MPVYGMLDIGMGTFEANHFSGKTPKHVKRNAKKSKMARASRRNNRRR